MTLDKIVEMCDELIEAHGDLLPPLDKQVLVPTSGKTFSPPTPQELRDSWDAAQALVTADHIETYQLLAPFTDGPHSADEITPPGVEEVMAADGSVDVTKEFKGVAWKEASTERGFLNLLRNAGHKDNSVAFAAFEYESIHQRETVLKLRSDDIVQIWLNGKEVLTHENGEEEKAIFLQDGMNHFLVKVDKKMPIWGFHLEVPRANF